MASDKYLPLPRHLLLISIIAERMESTLPWSEHIYRAAITTTMYMSVMTTQIHRHIDLHPGDTGQAQGANLRAKYGEIKRFH